MKIDTIKLVEKFINISIDRFILMSKKKFLYKIEMEGVNNAKIPLPLHPYHIVDQSP